MSSRSLRGRPRRSVNGADVDASYSSRNSENFATQTAPLSIGNLMLLRDRFDELVGRLKGETQERQRLARQLVDEQCFRSELVQAEAKQHTHAHGGHSDQRAVQLAKVVSNLRLKLRQAQEKVEHLECAATALSSSAGGRLRRQKGRGGGVDHKGGMNAEAALAFHNQKLKTKVAELEAQLKMAKIVAAEKVEVAAGQSKRLAAMELRLDDLTLDNDRLLEKSRSLLGKYRRSLGKMRELKVQVATADRRADKVDSRADGLSHRMATLRRRNQSLARTVDEKELELEQARFAHEQNEHKHQEVLATVHSKLDKVVSKNRALLDNLTAARDEMSVLENQNQRLRRKIARANSSKEGSEEDDSIGGDEGSSRSGRDHGTAAAGAADISSVPDASTTSGNDVADTSRSLPPRSSSDSGPPQQQRASDSGPMDVAQEEPAVHGVQQQQQQRPPHLPSPKLALGLLYHNRPDSPFDAELPEISVSDSEHNSPSATALQPSPTKRGHSRRSPPPTHSVTIVPRGPGGSTGVEEDDDVLAEAAASELTTTNGGDEDDDSEVSDEPPSWGHGMSGLHGMSMARNNHTRKAAVLGDVATRRRSVDDVAAEAASVPLEANEDGGDDSAVSDGPSAWGHAGGAATDVASPAARNRTTSSGGGGGVGGDGNESSSSATRRALEALDAEERALEEEFDVYNQE